MTATTELRTATPPRRLLLVIALVAAGLAVVVLANIHLVYTAVTSQPDCVEHLKATDGTAGSFRAAKPAC